MLLLCALIVGSSSAWAADKWVKTAPADLTSNDIVVIVDQNSSTAMSNDNGTTKGPSATEVTLNDGKDEITSEVAENLQWTVTVTTKDDVTTYKFGVSSDFLYCTNTNNGVRVGDNSNNAFTIYNNNGVDFLLNTETTRYLGVYSSKDWRCYTSINANIRATVLAFYKKTGDPSDTRTETSTTISEGYATEGAVNTTLDLPTATVKAGENAVEGAEVVWSSSDETVATISDGKINLLAAGTTTIKATYDGDETYKESNASYTLTVYDPTVKGTEYNPYTVEEAIEAIQALEKPASGISNAYVKGIVTKIDNIGSGALTYWISDDGINESQFEVYKGKSFGGAEFSSENDLEIGDIIVLKGKIVYYSKDNVYEFSSNSQIFSLKRNVAVTSAGWATYAATANMEFAEGDAFIVTAATTSATLSPVTKVPAGTPVILKGEGTKTATVLAEAPDAINGNMLKVGDGETATQNPYVLANKTKGVGFYKWEGTLADLNGKVYLEFETPTDPNPARDFIGFAETTGINGVEKATVENGQFFNLAGQRVAQPTKGLYIVNGKKVIIK